MEKFLSLAISGAVSGAIYSVIASGLVLAYVTSGVFNFAQGAVAFTAAYLYYILREGLGWPMPAAALASIVVYPVLLGLLLDRVMFRNLSKANDATKIVGTVGLLLALPSLALWSVEKLVSVFHWNIPTGANVYVAPGLGPSPKKTWNIVGTVVIDSNQLIIFGAALVSAALLWYVLRRTRLGLEMRATVDRRELASIRGIDPGRTSSVAWALSMMLAGLAGVVGAPIFGLSPDQYTLVLFVAATAAVLGGLRSIPLAFAGGLAIGVLQNLAAGYGPDFLSRLPGVRGSVPSILLLLALLFLGRQKIRTAGVSTQVVPPPNYLSDLPKWRRALPWAIAVAVLIYYVQFVADRYWAGLIAKGLGLSFIFMSIVVMTGIGGMVSLAQATFALGGAMTAGWAFGHDAPFLVAVALGAAVAAAGGLIIGAIGIRLGGLMLALATLALALMGDQLVFQIDSVRGGPRGWTIPRPDLGPIDLTSDKSMAMLFLVSTGLAVLVVRNLQRSATGRAMIAVRSSEPAAETSGISATSVRLTVFATSAALAGIGGALVSSFEGRVSNLSYLAIDSLIWLAIVVTFGVRRPGAAVLAGVVFTAAPEIMGWVTDSGRIPAILFGIGAINLARSPDGSMSQIVERNHMRRKNRRLRKEQRAMAAEIAAAGGSVEVTAATPEQEPVGVATGAGGDPTAAEASTAAPDGAPPDLALRLDGIVAGYGEVEVLHGVDLQLVRGSATALLGVNGAGKSTLYAVIAGLITAKGGRVEILGSQVDRTPPHKRVRGGLLLAPEGRGIFPGLTVDENLDVWLPSVEDREIAYDRFPLLAERKSLPAGSLSGGEQQILALAPLLVRRPDVLVVDEPTLGLAPLVIEVMFGLLRELLDDGVTLLLVEEKARDVLTIADRVVYLHLGRVLWDVPRDQVDDELLESAYLGLEQPAVT